MKAIQVTHLLSGKLQAKAEGVPAIRRSKESLDTENPKKDIAHQLANKYDWLQNGKYRLEEGCLPNLDAVFVFVKNPQPLLDEVGYILSIDYDSQNRNLQLCKDTVDTLREAYKKYTNG